MNIRTNSIGVIAQRVIATLRKSGCQVLAVKAAQVRPMIEIAYPTDELKRDALELKEQVNGLRRRAYAAASVAASSTGTKTCRKTTSN